MGDIPSHNTMGVLLLSAILATLYSSRSYRQKRLLSWTKKNPLILCFKCLARTTIAAVFPDSPWDKLLLLLLLIFFPFDLIAWRERERERERERLRLRLKSFHSLWWNWLHRTSPDKGGHHEHRKDTAAPRCGTDGPPTNPVPFFHLI